MSKSAHIDGNTNESQIKMKYLILLTLLIGSTALRGFAQQSVQTEKPPYNFTLEDCINYAYEHQDTVINAKLDVKSADYKIRETRA